MEQDELGGCFVISIEELGHNGLWSSIKDFLEMRSLLQNVLLSNKVGQEVLVDNLPVQYVLSSDKRLLRLKPFSHSPVTWFRNPYAHVILVSTAEANDYKATVKNMISKVVADLEREWGGATLTCEWIILYVRPFELDVNDRNAKRVFEKLRDDFGRKKRERCVRLDVPSKMFDPLGRRMPALGLEDLELCLKEAIQASFESRQAAYDEEVKKLVEERLEPAWSFTTLYLVKDSFALMLECAGLFEDALKEYMELELCYLEALQRKAVVSPDFGANSENDDMAQILTASWRTTRRAVLKKNGIPEFSFRQYLFAAQARLLLKLGRLLEVGERGLFFINSMMELLAEKQEHGVVRPYLRETWAFSACLVLVAIISASLAQPEPAQEELASYLDAARTGSVVGGRPGSRPPSQSQLPALRPPSMIGANAAAAAAPAKMDWDLGLSWSDTQSHDNTPVMGGKALLPALFSNFRSSQAMEAQHREVMEKMLYRLLGHMYLLARQQLLSLGQAVQFAGPLDLRPGITLPPSLQGLLDPSFGSLLSLTASYHARSGINVDPLVSQHSMATPRSGHESPRSEARSEVSSFAPATPEPASRHPSTNVAPPSPASFSSTPLNTHTAATPAKASPFTGQAVPPPPTPRSAAAGTIADSSPSMSPAQSAGPTMANGDVAAAGLVLRSVSEWRLRAALERQDSFDDLVQSLTSLTAWCFARANHWRSAALVSLEQAAMLIRRGTLDAGCGALESTVGKLEGWGLLHGYLLPHLLVTQSECKQPNLPVSLTKLLTLPPAFLLGQSRSTFSQHLHTALDAVAVSLDMSASQWRQHQFLAAYTVSNTFSRLCGVHDDANPLLVPPPQPPHPETAPPSNHHTYGACKVCAGDRSYVWLDLHNSLDEELELTNVVLVLGLLQPISPSSRGSGVYRQSSGSVRLTTGWQDAQDVVCHQITEAPADGRLPPASAWLQSEPSTVRLQPGRTRLVAATVPTHDGLYTLKHVAASLRGMKLHIHVQQSPEQLLGDGESRDHHALPFLRSVMPAVDPTSPSHIWGVANKDGEVCEELVVLAVESVRRRVECGLAAVGGCLVGGVHPQWLGLLLLPRHDSLNHCVVRLGARLTSEINKDVKGDAAVSSSGTFPDTGKNGIELFSGVQRALVVDLNKYEERTKRGEGGAASGADRIEGGTWVAATRGTVDLGQLALEGPAILWMQVAASCPSQEVEVVKVPRSVPGEPSGRHIGLYSDAVMESKRSERSRVVSMDVSLEYVCGCPRAHTCVLNMPLHPPFHLQLIPTLVSTNTTALQVVLQCGLLRGLVVTGLDVAPQMGLQLASHVAPLAALLPLRLDPMATASVTLLLQSGITEEQPAEHYKDQASVLSVTYLLQGDNHTDLPTQVVPGPFPADHKCWDKPLPAPPNISPTDLTSSRSSKDSSSSGHEQVFQHTFVLEFPAGQAVESDLQVQLLGPWSGRVGEPAAMSWQITRLSPGSKAQPGTSVGPDEMIYFEVNQDDSNWYSVCQGQGMLRLGRHAGAIATVEAVVVPQQAGSCPPPGLTLRGVSVSASDAYSQEIFIHAA